MTSALYNAMSAALSQSKALDITAHNIANSNTPGFRAQVVSFEQALGEAAPQVRVGEVATDTSRGEIKGTGNPLDLALPGPGFFAVTSASGDRFTRAGSFAVNSEGYVVNPDGLALQSSDGRPLQVPPHAQNIAVGKDGTVQADGEVVGQVRVVHMDQKDLMVEGTGFVASPTAAIHEVESPHVQSGALEGSNFRVVRGMIDLVRASRTYEAAVRTMQTVSENEKRTARGFGSAG